MKSLLKHILTLITGIVITLLALPYFASAGDSYAPPAQIAPVLSLVEQERLFAQVYETVAPSVVAINFSIRTEGQQLYTAISSGSGFVIDMQGHIVTNSHVIQIPPELAAGLELTGEEETRVEVRMFDGTISAAE